VIDPAWNAYAESLRVDPFRSRLIWFLFRGNHAGVRQRRREREQTPFISFFTPPETLELPREAGF
jgi:hypothetical protein